MDAYTKLSRTFIYCLGFLISVYVGFEFFFNAYAMFGVDEFWFAHRIYQYKSDLPYKDFAPYKTVLGYYLLLLPMLFQQGTIATLITIKNALALLNASVFLIAAFWLRRLFGSAAVLSCLALLICSELVLSYSTNIRVDLIGYWFCFFAFFCVLAKREGLAGFLLGLGFITTQKAIWYVAATNFSLCVYGLWLARSRQLFWAMLRLNTVLIGVIFSYLIFWAWISDWHTVWQSVFTEARIMYRLDWYDSARKLFWSAVILANPLLFLLCPLSIFSLLIRLKNDNQVRERLLVVVFSLTILGCLIPYRQVFPYYMQVTIPIFFLLYSAFFSWLIEVFKPDAVIEIKGSRAWLWGLTAVYLTSLLYIFFLLQLPEAYLFIASIPFLLVVYLNNAKSLSAFASLFFTLIVISVIFVGSVYPLILFTTKMMNLDGRYQKQNLTVLENLLADGSGYVAGIELLYAHTQPIPGMRHLMGPAIDYLYYPSQKLKPVMLASLYEDPTATQASVLHAMALTPIKAYVNNYRMAALPKAIRAYLSNEFEHWWGSLYIYAPLIRKDSVSFTLKFSGWYSLEAPVNAVVRINHAKLDSGNFVFLTKGSYTVRTTKTFRLKLIPQNVPTHDQHYHLDQMDKIIF